MYSCKLNVYAFQALVENLKGLNKSWEPPWTSWSGCVNTCQCVKVYWTIFIKLKQGTCYQRDQNIQ